MTVASKRDSPGVHHDEPVTVMANDMEMEQGDAEWAEALALRILLARVRPERHAEAAERVRSIVRDCEAPRATRIRRLPRMIVTSRRRA